MIAANPATYVDYFRVRIDPTRSADTTSLLRFDFPNDISAGLDVRRAVVEFVPDPAAYGKAPDIILTMSSDTWAKLYLSQATPESLIETGAIKVTGDATEAARVLNLFDRVNP